MKLHRLAFAIALAATASALRSEASGSKTADWPQFMRNPQHTGDAADEVLKMPLGLVAQVKLDDAVTTSPAVVGGRVYVVDQMGTAYCVDPLAGRILWRAAPDGAKAMGSNTSSPCVARGRVYFGTTAGTFHVLSAADGKVVRTLRLGSPVLGSPTFANGSIYFQTVDSVLYCLDLDGQRRWTWDHYQRYTKPIPEKLKHYHPRSYDRPHFGGGEVAVAGKKVVTAFGWDQVCLEDRGKDATLVWCNRAALGKDAGIPAAMSIAGGWIYTAWPGVDGAGSLVRFSLADGSHAKSDQRSTQWAIFSTPAVRGPVAYWGRHIRGVTAYEFSKGTQWESFRWSRPEGFTPTITSPALSRDHCLFTTLDGELIAVNLASRGGDLPTLKPKPFRFQTAGGRVIGSSPAVSGGRVYFGSDDGCLYVLGPGGNAQPRKEGASLHRPRSKVRSATGKRYAWPSPYGGPTNTNFVDDARLRPPLRLRWAVRSFGCFKQPLSASEQDVVYVTLAGTVVCLEQATGRLRWRRRLPRQRWARPGVLCAGERVYVPRPRMHVKPTPRISALFCLDAATGRTRWKADIGMGGSSRAAPVLVGEVLAFGTRRGDEPVIEAWGARTGKPAWQVKLDARAGNMPGPSGCAHGGTMYFTVGVGKWRWKQVGGHPRGQTVAIEAKTGKVLWKTAAFHGCGSATPAVRDGASPRRSGFALGAGRLYVADEGEVICASAADGKVLWRKRVGNWFHSPSIGPDYFTGRGYSGRATRYGLADQQPQKHAKKTIQLGGPEHACGPVLLTSGGISIAVTVGGLHLRDVATGELLWRSKGFAPRTCSNAIASNGRIFYNPQVDGTLYCFEPASPEGDRQ